MRISKRGRRPLKKSLYALGVLVFMTLTLTNCAKRGTPSGGPLDTIPPAFVKAIPPNFTTNFSKDEIRIYFNEYIKLTDTQKQLITSPPLKNSIITPQGSASKVIKIKITDTLIPNTTYVFNFGQSIQDNNESNPYSSFKYVMSTGSFIDSLTVKGTIVDELASKPDDFVSVMLYEVDESLTDSIVFKESPRYVTNTLDSLTSFEIGNIKEGKYMLIAMKDENANYTFQPKKDKIAFLKEYITIPTDSSYTLKLFKENHPLKVSRPKQAGEGHISFNVEGAIDSVDITLLTPKPNRFTSLWTQKANQDSIHFWYKPKMEIDSLLFEARGIDYVDTLFTRLRNKSIDSLTFTNATGRTLTLNKPLEIYSSTPINTIKEELVTVYKDSTSIPFSIQKDTMLSALTVDFKREESSRYQVQFLPGAVTDFFEAVNDTLTYTVSTKEKSDYGNIELNLDNATRFPYIVRLTNNQGEILEETHTTQETHFNFELLTPGKYLIQLIEDANGNGIYDTGNYLERKQPEKVINYGKVIEVRPSWSVVETFILKD